MPDKTEMHTVGFFFFFFFFFFFVGGGEGELGQIFQLFGL